jgi:transcriptional regulator of arginine metabolism
MGMKADRQKKIMEIVADHPIENQEDLVAHLKSAGYEVTQATISRDIRELGLVKQGAGGAGQRYQYTTAKEAPLEDKYMRVLREGFTSMDAAQNMLVVKTVSGMAMAVAAAIDAMHFSEVVGSIAGDDTILAVIRTAEDARVVMGKLKKLLEG